MLSSAELQNHQLEHPNDTCTVENDIILVKKQGIRKIYVSFSLWKAHEVFRHVGVKKTLKLLTLHYYWAEIIHDVSKFVRHCDVCQKCKKSKKKFGRLKALSPTVQPFDLVAIDTIEGLGEYG